MANRKSIILYTSLLIIFSYLILLLDQESIDALVREDALVENIGTLGLFVTFICFGVAFLKSGKAENKDSHTTIKRISYLVLALIFFFGAGEEISWGQRIFGFTTPETWAAVNTQNELNLHNLETFSGGAFIMNTDRIFALFWGTLMVVIPLVAQNKLVRHWLDKYIPVFPWWQGALFVFNYLVAKIAKAMLLDTGLYHGIYSNLSESIVEIKEAVFGVLFAMVGLYLIQVLLIQKPKYMDSVLLENEA